MGHQINLLRSLPQGPNRPVERRASAKTPEMIALARQYGEAYFDGPRECGYGGYYYDGRWVPVARDILSQYGLTTSASWRILDVGCAKGFLVNDLLMESDLGVEVFGLDISRYALMNCPQSVIGRLHLGDARSLPFPDDSFDLVLSVNTLHNLERGEIITALQEIMRVSRAATFVQVDSYKDEAGRSRFLDWVLTARWHGYPDEWRSLFTEAGYEGDYDFTTV